MGRLRFLIQKNVSTSHKNPLARAEEKKDNLLKG